MRVLNRLLQRLVILGSGVVSVWLIQRMLRQQAGALTTRGRVSVKHRPACPWTSLPSGAIHT